MDVEIRARIPLVYLPSGWCRLVDRIAEQVVEEEICKIGSNDFVIDDGLVLRRRIGNACLDDYLQQLHAIARYFGVEPIIRWRYL